MGLVDHARAELAQMMAGDEADRAMAADALALVELFAQQGHSGCSANACRRIFDRLAQYKPLGPLTGAPEEWVHVHDRDGLPVYQNRRRSSVFREGDGRPYDMDAVVFRDRSGGLFQCRQSMEMGVVAFPYDPPDEARVVDVEEQEDGRYQVLGEVSR